MAWKLAGIWAKDVEKLKARVAVDEFFPLTEGGVVQEEKYGWSKGVGVRGVWCWMEPGYIWDVSSFPRNPSHSAN